jgi:hypothetical protein
MLYALSRRESDPLASMSDVFLRLNLRIPLVSTTDLGDLSVGNLYALVKLPEIHVIAVREFALLRCQRCHCCTSADDLLFQMLV